MFRITFLSVTLIVAAGPSAGLLCGAWCHPQNVVASTCHHEEARATVASNESCDAAVLNVAAVLPEEMLRGVSSSIGHYAIPAPRYQLFRPTIDVCLADEREHHWPLERRPLETSLRI
ncbi:MAG TPA: hypothetical protein VJM31_01720 [Vicinamibacterales bacterium]|nr:hypothetical protein [Vicinamibacterales bacterium]